MGLVRRALAVVGLLVVVEVVEKAGVLTVLWRGTC